MPNQTTIQILINTKSQRVILKSNGNVETKMEQLERSKVQWLD